MKILTKKKQEEILKRLVANSIIFIEGNKDEEYIGYFAENTTEISFLVGGLKGMEKVTNTTHKRFFGKDGR